MFTSPSVVVSLPDYGDYQIRLMPDVPNPKGTPVVMVNACDRQGDMLWQREEDMLGKPFWMGAIIAINAEGLQILSSAIQPGNPQARTYFELEGDYVRFMWTTRAKKAVESALEKALVQQLELLWLPMKEAFDVKV